MLSQVSPLAVALALSILSLLASNVGAHQTMMVPKPAYVSDDKETRHNPVAFLENQNFSTQLDFQDYMKKNKYSSLRDFMDNAKYTPAKGADFSCGFTKSDAPPEPIPKSCSVRSSGYTHDGPCALYLDDVKIYEKANCHTDIPGKEIQVDYSSCKGTCMLRWYWLGIRTLKNIVSWQVYKICVPLKRDPKDEICGAGDGTGQR
ncbi:hypothetical protein CCR75_009400 [Bremia lactucae]|uniref:Secreted protein n=1 Tax=Bremia lactucae TaxID=4779 RepID=A0A976FIR5_BRELC|nr:hypothetical protein CCR75_009400 [Bremia lactucae]